MTKGTHWLRGVLTMRVCLAMGVLAISFQGAASETLAMIQVPREALRYQAEFRRIQGAGSPQSMEKLFNMGERVRKAFLSRRNRALLEAARVEAMTDPRAQTALDKLVENLTHRRPGYRIGQGAELFYDDADADVYLALAEQHGQEIDRDFFTRYQASFPRGESWPAHEEQQTDISSCTRYGSPEFVGHHARWQGFLTKHPRGFYADKARTYLANHFDVTRRCSCDSKAATLTGLETLELALQPGKLKDSVATEIRQRTGDPDNKAYYYRYDGRCQAG